jgi:hypothetical protein
MNGKVYFTMTGSTTDTRGKSAEGVLGPTQEPNGHVNPRYPLGHRRLFKLFSITPL